MSIRAMNWAMEQATGCPWTQCLLYVVADAANPDGICWPSADWMAEKSQQSRATVYRRLGELRDLGLLALFPRFIDDDGKIHYEGAAGRRQTSPEIRLIFSVKVDMPRKRVRRNPDENDDDGEGGVSLSATGESPLSDSPPVAAERQPPSHCSDSEKNRNLNQEDSPQPPKGGDEQFENCEGWDEFKAEFEADKEPIVRVSIAKQLFTTLSWPEERKRVTKAARGLIAWRRRQKKPTAKPSAQTFIREIDAWASWEKHAPSDPVQVDPPVFVPEDSMEWRALCVMAAIHNDDSPVARYIDGHGRGLMRPKRLTPQKLALAQFDQGGKIDTSEWQIFEARTNQCGAWRELLGAESFNIPTGEVVPKEVLGKIVNWKVMVHGLRVPCEWPPRKDGSLGTTGPPDHNLSEEDIEALSNWK